MCTLHTGLKYAEEIGKEGDPNPRYFCHLCKVHMDFSNVGLHFTSTAHRHIVLVREYFDEWRNFVGKTNFSAILLFVVVMGKKFLVTTKFLCSTVGSCGPSQCIESESVI